MTLPQPIRLVFVQQLSVPLASGSRKAQYSHRPRVLVANPQLFGSFLTASIHCPLIESAGSAQFVKSALIESR